MSFAAWRHVVMLGTFVPLVSSTRRTTMQPLGKYKHIEKHYNGVVVSRGSVAAAEGGAPLEEPAKYAKSVR